MRTSAIALTASFALLSGCAGTALDPRDIPMVEQQAQERLDHPASRGEVESAAAQEETSPASDELRRASVESGQDTVGTVVEDTPGQAESSNFWAENLDSEHYPEEASHGASSITLSARADQAKRIQLASLQEVTEIAQNAEPGEEYDGDPFEPVNRFFFAINETLDTFILRPIAVTYGFWVPQGVRNTVRNFLRNLRAPVVLANDIFQGDLERAETTAARFFLNSTVGVGGLFDVASGEGWDYHDEDFGQTLGVHGFGEGAYLVLPVLGPSSARDTIGLIVDHFLDPMTYLTPWETRVGLAGSRAIDYRSRTIELTDDLKRDSIDYYARIRSLYRQTREDDIRNGAEDDGTIEPSSVSDLE